MKSVRDCFGRSVRLTEERMAHILQHQEMVGMEAEIEGVLQSPAEVRVSSSDDRVQLFYEFYAQTSVGGKWLCVGGCSENFIDPDVIAPDIVASLEQFCLIAGLTVITYSVIIRACDQDVQVRRYAGSFEGQAGQAIHKYRGGRAAQATAVGNRGPIGRFASAARQSVGSPERQSCGAT
jgi:hypothetical protein